MPTLPSTLRAIALVLFAATTLHCGASTSPRSDGSTTADGRTTSDVATADATSAACVRNSDCGDNRVCQFEMGCEVTVGRCTDASCQSLPVAPQYCGCNGATIQGTSACLPDRPWASMGPCRSDAGVEGGARFVCGESTCDALLEFCQRPRGPGTCPPPGSPICPRGCPGCPSLPPPSCAPVPAPCAMTPTCDCIAREVCGDPRSATCEGVGGRGITLGCISA